MKLGQGASYTEMECMLIEITCSKDQAKLIFQDNGVKVFDAYTLEEAVDKTLIHVDNQIVLDHTQRVTALAGDLARRYRVSVCQAKMAALLHDISAIVPNKKKLALCEDLGMAISDLERRIPALIHGRLSAVMAQVFYDIRDPEVLQAIACHTTLKSQPDDLDMILFCADKIEWDQADQRAFHPRMRSSVLLSLEQASLDYIHFAIHEEGFLMEAHPDLLAAYDWLKDKKAHGITKEDHMDSIIR